MDYINDLRSMVFGIIRLIMPFLLPYHYCRTYGAYNWIPAYACRLRRHATQDDAPPTQQSCDTNKERPI